MFSQDDPVLGGVDLDSCYLFSLALRASRSGADWAEVLGDGQAQGLDLSVVVKDAGAGIDAGVQKVFPSERLMDQVREVLRYHHYAIRTEQTYVNWILQFIRFNGIRHPMEMGKPEIEQFLSHLAMNRNVAPSTQNQAMNAIF